MPPNQVQSPIGVQFLRTSQAGQQVGGLDKPIRTREKYGTDEPTANRSVNATIPVQNAVQPGMMPMNAAPQSQPIPAPAMQPMFPVHMDTDMHPQSMMSAMDRMSMQSSTNPADSFSTSVYQPSGSFHNGFMTNVPSVSPSEV